MSRHHFVETFAQDLARQFGWNLHPNPQALEAEIESMNIRDTQYAVANKIPYKQSAAWRSPARTT
jgi:hypothetical protein